MYGKFFASTFTGSMFGAGANVFAVWGYTIANTVEGAVELNPSLLAAVLGMTPAEVDVAIEHLCRADIKSRSKDENGSRLVHEGGFQYHVVNHAHYRALRNEEDRRAYNREAKRKERAVKRDVIDKHRMSNMSAHTEAEAEAEADTETEAKSAETKTLAPLAARPQSNHHKSLIGTHTKCPEGTWAACARGLCVPTKLYAEWRAQFADTTEASEQIVALVDRAVAELGDGPVGDTPYDFWRAVWRAQHASRAPFAPSPHTKGNQTVANMQRVLAKLKAEQA